jgi:hypothetical protein
MGSRVYKMVDGRGVVRSEFIRALLLGVTPRAPKTASILTVDLAACNTEQNSKGTERTESMNCRSWTHISKHRFPNNNEFVNPIKSQL